ncbi:hypothetical protein EVAR_73594_1 [Eumeta japonica]|uniref:Uncharacterized protein n=1 Tax=Eumeta variegata TaxID=151549 RepID=A0A4C1SC07_EUMVA|nr:hypothetical protein EVAR_73594_1 [Eumeta japonica]
MYFHSSRRPAKVAKLCVQSTPRDADHAPVISKLIQYRDCFVTRCAGTGSDHVYVARAAATVETTVCSDHCGLYKASEFPGRRVAARGRLSHLARRTPTEQVLPRELFFRSTGARPHPESVPSPLPSRPSSRAPQLLAPSSLTARVTVCCPGRTRRSIGATEIES